jgi:ABC-2 type transport system ATP-binding protein
MNSTNVPMSNVLEVDQVSKSYAARKALDRVNLSVAAGEFVALLGPNGAGKTTLFQLTSGLFVADGGRILIEDRDLRTETVAALAGIGIVFQQPTLDLDLSVHANLRFHTRLHGMDTDRAERRIQEELERLDLLDRSADVCRTLSGGIKRKVELARALLHEPRLLLMDEATVGLDPASRRGLLEYVYGLCDSRDLGVLWATHLVDEAERASRVVVLHQGRLLCEGTPQELIQRTGANDLSGAFLKLTGKPGDSEEEND